jgi:hypothetical protein
MIINSERCGKEISQKSQYDYHNRYKNTTENNNDKINIFLFN